MHKDSGERVKYEKSLFTRVTETILALELQAELYEDFSSPQMKRQDFQGFCLEYMKASVWTSELSGEETLCNRKGGQGEDRGGSAAVSNGDVWAGTQPWLQGSG